jgi:UDP-N-acetylglucosamine transferase subunit ALG13
LQSKRATVLVCVLNWGIGHATRSIPVIRELLKQNLDVVICSDGHALDVLREAFSELPFEILPAYNVMYAKGGNIVLKMAFQLPKFIAAIQREHIVVDSLIDKYSAKAVIADNRYGCYSNKAKSIFITHQLNILMPNGFSLLQKAVYAFNKRQIARFDVCWVPDVEGSDNLAGILAHGTDIKADFIGWLSRMEYRPVEKKYDVAVVLSGPEPQRSLFEKKVKEQLLQLKKGSIIIRGIPVDSRVKRISAFVEEVDYMNAAALNEVMLQSNIIVSRSGYSTIMDLQLLGGKALLIPTPGQTEQQYLAESLMEKNIVYSVSQNNLNLKDDLKKAASCKGFIPATTQNSLLSSRIALLKAELC